MHSNYPINDSPQHLSVDSRLAQSSHFRHKSPRVRRRRCRSEKTRDRQAPSRLATRIDQIQIAHKTSLEYRHETLNRCNWIGPNNRIRLDCRRPTDTEFQQSAVQIWQSPYRDWCWCLQRQMQWLSCCLDWSTVVKTDVCDRLCGRFYVAAFCNAVCALQVGFDALLPYSGIQSAQHERCDCSRDCTPHHRGLLDLKVATVECVGHATLHSSWQRGLATLPDLVPEVVFSQFDPCVSATAWSIRSSKVLMSNRPFVAQQFLPWAVRSQICLCEGERNRTKGAIPKVIVDDSG
jgi:hypothetical protein